MDQIIKDDNYNTLGQGGLTRRILRPVILLFLLFTLSAGLCLAEPIEEEAEEVYIAYSPYTLFREPADDANGELPLGNLIADSYRYASGLYAPFQQADVAIVSSSLLFDPLFKGVQTEESIRQIMPYGRSEDSGAGYKLIGFHLNLSELFLIAEADYMAESTGEGPRFYFSGLSYSAAGNRLPYNKVAQIGLAAELMSDKYEPAEDGLYYVVTDRRTAEDILAIGERVHGLWKLSLKSKTGAAFSDDAAYYIGDENESATNISALSSYITSFPVYTQGLPGVPKYYSEPRGRKLDEGDSAYSGILRNLNSIGKLMVGAAIFALVILAVLLYLLIKKIALKRRPKIIYVNNLKYR